MRITSIQIHPAPETESRVKATVDVVLNETLALRGIKIMHGRYGLFLAFPGSATKSSYRIFDTVSMRLRRQLQEEILRAYRADVTRALPLFH